MNRDYTHHDELEDIFADAGQNGTTDMPAVVYEHPTNKKTRAAWERRAAVIRAAGYEITEVEGERPDRPDYRIEFGSREEQIEFIKTMTELSKEENRRGASFED